MGWEGGQLQITEASNAGGVVFDIPLIQITQTNDGDRELTKQFNLQIGVLSSALEHTTPEQMFNTDPITRRMRSVRSRRWPRPVRQDSRFIRSIKASAQACGV